MPEKIKRYGVDKYNGFYTLMLPKDSLIIGVIPKETEPGMAVVQLLVEEPLTPKSESPELEAHKVLVVDDESPFGANIDEENEFLHYIGTAPWDNAYRISHVFEVVKYEEPAEFLLSDDEQDCDICEEVVLSEPEQEQAMEVNEIVDVLIGEAKEPIKTTKFEPETKEEED